MKNKSLIVNSVVAGLSVFVLGASMLIMSGETRALKREIAKQESIYNSNANELVAIENESREKITEVETVVTGVSNKQLKDDKSVAELFFTDAFTWKSGEEYDSIRNRYIQLLGAENQFVTSYLAENVKVEVKNDNIANNYIDLNKMKSKFDKIDLYPTSWNPDGTISYVGVVTYYTYTRDGDLDSKKGLKPSKAIVEFSMVNSPDGKYDRKLTELTAYAGSF